MATTAVNQAAAARDKFVVDREVHGGITYITMSGTLNVDFIGRKLTKIVKSKRIVINMHGVRRFASWGMSEWMEFLRMMSDRDIYIVECSTYALSQLNLITGLLGHAKLVSYYASFRCGKCSEEIESQFIIPRDREMISDLPQSQQECPTCGGNARLEEYPAAFFETIAERPPFDIDDEVLAFLRTHLNYDIEADLTRFRAYRTAKNGYTYLKLSGNLSVLPSETLAQATDGTAVVDLEGAVFDPDELAPWYAYVKGAMARAKSVQLLSCPPGFLDSAVRTADLRDKLKIRTFALPYDCPHCERTAAHVIDVASNLEQLAEGSAPTVRCPTCRGSLVAALSTDQSMLLRALPARDRDPALDKFLAASKELSVDKLENCLVATAAVEAPKSAAVTAKTLYVAVGAATFVITGLVVGLIWLREDPKQPVVINNPNVGDGSSQATGPQFVRPEWIISAIPSTAYCHDVINRLMCVGVSSYRTSRDEGATEASDAALEELVTAIALKVSDPMFKDAVMPRYSESRAKLLAALQTADLDRKTDKTAAAAYKTADEAVRKARKRVVEVLHASGGAAVPTQRSDWYWEEYAGEAGAPNEMLVFVRYDISLDAMRTLVETYSSTQMIQGSAAMTAFPALGWRYDDFAGGALLTKVSPKMTAAGIEPQAIVTAVGDAKVIDASGLARRFEEAKGDVKLTVMPSNGPTKVVDVKK